MEGHVSPFAGKQPIEDFRVELQKYPVNADFSSEMCHEARLT